MTSATIATEKGDIDVDLFTTDAPKASQNFIDLAKKGFYDDVVFHRVISGFVIQAGDGEFGKKSALNRGRVGQGGPGYKFEDEPIKGDYVRGALAMANAGPNTNGSQFFICHADLTGRLPKNYTLFGQVTKGLDVVDAIASAADRENPLRPGRDDRRSRSTTTEGCREPWNDLAANVKEFTPARTSILLDSRRHRVSMGGALRKQPRCPSDKVMGR